MIGKGQTERDGLASCEALPGYMIGGTEENHEILQLIQAVSGPKYVTRRTQIHRAASACLTTRYGGERGSEIVVVTSLATASDDASW